MIRVKVRAVVFQWRRVETLCSLCMFNKVIRLEPSFAVLTIDQRIDKSLHTPTRLPCPRMVDDRRVDSDDIFMPTNHLVPPEVRQLALHFDTERTVIVAGSDAA